MQAAPIELFDRLSVAAVIKVTGGCVYGVPITAPSLGALKQGVGMTRKWGTCVLIGLPLREYPTPVFDVVANCITIRVLMRAHSPRSDGNACGRRR